MAKITIFKDNGYKGRQLEFNNSYADLENEGFNDMASSCKIESGTWILYKDSNFRSEFSILGPGDYSDPRAMGISNDSLSSLRLLPDSGICLFKDSNYGSRMVALTGNNSNLDDIHFNDQTSSVIVISGYWNLYKDSDFRGTQWTLKPGRYETPEKGGFNNDQISSVQLDK